MKQLREALFSPYLLTIFAIPVGGIIAAFIGDALGWFDPDYQKLCFVGVLGYVVGVLIELGVFSRRGST